MKEITNYLSFETFRIRENIALKEFCKKNNFSELSCVAESENLKYGDVVVVKNLDKKLHIVLPLENLEKIAQKHNVSVQYIKDLNKIDKIFIGQQLYI